MARVELDLDPETFARLTEEAVAERRPVGWQAEITLRRALGLPFPYARPGDESSGTAASNTNATR